MWFMLQMIDRYKWEQGLSGVSSSGIDTQEFPVGILLGQVFLDFFSLQKC